MARHKGLSNTAPSNPFAEGAARFADIARQVKAQQVAEQQGGAQPAGPVHTDAPDEIWAKKFMSQAIGPAGIDAAIAPAPVWHAPAAIPEFASLRREMMRSREFAPKKDLGLPERHGVIAPMGTGLGKDERPRRSWLGRLFRGA